MRIDLAVYGGLAAFVGTAAWAWSEGAANAPFAVSVLIGASAFAGLAFSIRDTRRIAAALTDDKAEDAAGRLRAAIRSRLQRQDFLAKRDTLSLTDALDGETRFTVGKVTDRTAKVSQLADGMIAAAADMTGRSAALESDAVRTAANVEAVASAAKSLSDASADIGREVDGAATIAREAVMKAQAATATIQRMVEATAEIDKIRAMISAIASQTDMLSLNAAIEAEHAGEAGRGFAVVAENVNALADRTGKATARIAEEVRSITAIGREALDAVAEMESIVTRIDRAASVIHQVVERQSVATREIAGNADEVAIRTRQVSEGVREVAERAARNREMAGDVQTFAGEAARQLDELRTKLGAVLKQSAARYASRTGALPLPLPVAIVSGADRIACTLHEMTAETAVLRPVPEGIRAGAAVAFDVPEVGIVPADLARAAEGGLAVSFRGDLQTTGKLRSLLSGYLALDAPVVTAAKEGARKLGAMLEREIARGGITMDDLFDEDYRPIPGSDPKQYMTRFVSCTDRLFPEVQEPMLGVMPGIVFCAAVDRNGFLPTHNKVYSQPQGSDPVWNAANCRNRRLFDDRTGLSAGRNTEPYLLQSYLRDMGGGRLVMMQDLSAPIVVNGRHWGGLRVGYTLTDA